MTNRKGLLAVIFIIALIVRLGVFLHSFNAGEIPTWEYEELADNILSGKGYVLEHLEITNRFFGPPLYPFFCSFIYQLNAHSQTSVILIQILLSCLTCVLIFRLSRFFFNDLTSFIAGLLVSFHPGLIIYSIRLHPLTIDVFLLVCLVIIFVHAIYSNRLLYFVLLGIACGLILYTRTVLLIFILLNLLIYVLRSRDKMRSIKMSLLVVLIMFLIVFPWTVRNYLIVKKLVFVQNSGEVFWRGNNINATGTSYTSDGAYIFNTASKKFKNTILNADNEIVQDKIFWKQGVSFITKNPYRFIKLTFLKLRYFWWFSPQQGREYPVYYFYAYRIFYLLCLCFGLIGLWHMVFSLDVKIKLFLLISVILFVSVSFMHSFFYVEGRHRWLIEPIFLIFSAFGCKIIFGNLKKCLQKRT